MQRHLTIDRIENIRDLGGHPTRHGKLTSWKAFVRADHYQPWSEATRQALVDYGVSLVVDLRMPEEAQGAAAEFAPTKLRYQNIPLLTQAQINSERYQWIDKNRRENGEFYLYILEECREPIRRILSAMAENVSGATLFHCYIGRDRTGVIAALLLSLADAEHDAIVHDYTLTEEHFGERLAQWRASAIAEGADAERARVWTAASPQSMRMTLQHLHERHGGGEAYVKACGVGDDVIARLRERLL